MLLTEIKKLEIKNYPSLNEFFEKTKKIKDLSKCPYFQVSNGSVMGEQLSPKIA